MENPQPPSPRPWPQVAVWVLLFKVLTFVLIFLCLQLLPRQFQLGSFRANFHHPQGKPFERADMLRTWDAQHYLYLAQFGYEAKSVSSGMFPLWPMLIRATAPLFRFNYLATALVLANLLSVAALVLFHRLVALKRGGAVADTTLLLYLAYPGAFFLCLPYSEPLFLVLAVATFYLLETGRWKAAAAMGFLLPLARGVGGAIVLVFAYEFYRRWRSERRPPLRLIPLLAAPLAGIGAYFLFFYIATGDPTEGFRAVADPRWVMGGRSLLNTLDPVGLFRSITDVGRIHGITDSAIDRLWFFWLLAALVVLWRKDKRSFFYAAPIGLIPVLTLSFVSNTRHFLGVFPAFVVAAEALEGERARPLKWALLGLFACLQVVFVIRHINNLWVG